MSTHGNTLKSIPLESRPHRTLEIDFGLDRRETSGLDRRSNQPSGHPSTLMEIYNRIQIDFMPPNTTFIL